MYIIIIINIIIIIIMFLRYLHLVHVCIGLNYGFQPAFDHTEINSFIHWLRSPTSVAYDY